MLVGEPIDLVEHHRHHRAVAGQTTQVSVMQGGIGVLLRVDDPHHEIDHRDETVNLQLVRYLGGIVIGKIEQDEPVERVPLGHLNPARHLEPVEELRRWYVGPVGGQRL